MFSEGVARKKTTNFSAEFSALREKSKLTMLEAGQKCDLAESTVWKAEHGHSVRWETVHLILAIAFKVKPDSPEYSSLHSLWLQQRQEKAMKIAPGHATKKLSKDAVEAVRKFRILIRDMKPADMKKTLAAAQRAAKGLRAG